MRYLHILSLCLSVAASGPLLPQPEIRSMISNVLSEWGSPAGVGIAIVQLNDDPQTKPIPELNWITEAEGFGNATFSGSLVNADTQFAIASNSKLFTVLAIGQALEEAKDRFPDGWKTKICPDLLPDWCNLSERMENQQDEDWKTDLENVSKEATIEDLMSHQTGWPRHDNSYEFTTTTQELLTTMLPNLRRSTAFRAQLQYNNLIYAILSAIPGSILNATEPFTQLVKSRIFEPLGLSQTTYTRQQAENLADGLTRHVIPPRPNQGLPEDEPWKVLTTGEVKQMPWWDPVSDENGSFMSGAAGIISSARDIATWLKVLLLKGADPATGNQVIPSSAIDKAATGLVLYSSPSWPEMSAQMYGGGQWTGSYRGKQYVEHLGDTLGFLTRITRFPEDGVGIAVLANDDLVGGYVHEVIKWNVVDKLFDLEYIDWNQRFKDQISAILRSRSSTTSPPSNGTAPSISDIWALEGQYHNAGYGDLDVCVVANSFEGQRPNSNCQDIVNDVTDALPGVFNYNVSLPDLVIRKNNVWLSHFKLSHFDGALWNVTLWKSIESPNDTANPWAYGLEFRIFADSATAEFAFEQDGDKSTLKGLGLRGVWGAAIGVPSPGGDDVQSRSEIWLERR